MTEIIETIGGEYGATVRYSVHENGGSVSFFAAEITGQGHAQGEVEWRPVYGSSIDEASESFENAERYVEGFVKWDGCSHVSFGDENAQLHLCGKSEFDKLAMVLAAIYERCGELMQAVGTKLLEGQF